MKLPASLLTLLLVSFASLAQKPEVAIVMDMSHDSLLHASGYAFFVESIGKHISPLSVDDRAFDDKRRQIEAMKTKLIGVNIFIPTSLKVVGPDADPTAVLRYAEAVMKRVRQLKVDLIIWGSGGSRRLPDGFDRAVATRQFVALAQQVADLAKKYQITVALENLNSTETNFLTRLTECIDVVRQVDRTNFRLAPDIYHMLKENEPAGVLVSGKHYIVHVDIAEKEGRTPPGTHGDDFTPYLRELKSMNYQGKLVLECNWNDLKKQALPARLELQRQIDVVWGK